MVQESSAAPILDDTERAGLPYDHSTMCKFESKTSPGYRVIVAAMIRYSKAAPDVIVRRWVAVKEMLKAKRMNEAAELMQ